jgi:hypothetical protein
MSSGMIAIENQTDSKMYDIAFDPDGLPSDLVVGSDVSVSTSFDGKRYKASEIKIEKTTTPVASTGS